MAALASDLEGDIVGGVALDLEGAGRQVVEILVEELEGHCQSMMLRRWGGSSSGKWRLSAHTRTPMQGPRAAGRHFARTSFAALEISWKAGTDILAVVVSRVRLWKIGLVW